MDSLPQYLQILAHQGDGGAIKSREPNRWTQLIYLANSGWLGTNPRSIFTNRYNSNYIDKLLDLPLGIPSELYTTHHANDGDLKLGWASNIDLDNDDDGIMRFYYGGDQPSNNGSEDSDDTWRRGHDDNDDEEVDDDDDDEEEDSDDTPVIITRGVPFYSLLGRRFNSDSANQHHSNVSQTDDAHTKTDTEDTETNNTTIPFKLIPHRDVFVGNDDDTITVESGVHFKVNGIYLKPECILLSADSTAIRDKVILTPLYSLRTSCISSPFPHLTLNQHVRLYEDSDLTRKLNSERRLKDDDSLYTSFISSTNIPPGIGVYYFEVKIVNLNLNINDGMSIGFTSLNSMNVNDASWCDDSIKIERMNSIWEAKSGKFCYYNDLRAYDPTNHASFQQQVRENWPKYAKGDIIGLGIDFVKGTTFGTKNGVLIGESNMMSIVRSEDAQYITINLGVHSEVEVNLGKSCFQFDILNYVRDKKSDVMNKIKGEPFIPFSIPDGEIIRDDLSISHFVDKLVLGYLKHRGYVNTAVKLSNEIGEVTDKDTWDWQDISKFKKTLKELLRNDEIDEIMNSITIKFPNFWLTYQRIEFKLLCFKYINLIANSNNSDFDIKRVLRFGKLLNRKFSNDELYLTELDQISQFLAYDDPKDCPQWDSIVNLGKEKILEALIMAISETVGLSCLTGFDLGLLRTDVNLESLKRQQRKDLVLIDILNDYIKL